MYTYVIIDEKEMELFKPFKGIRGSRIKFEILIASLNSDFKLLKSFLQDADIDFGGRVTVIQRREVSQI